MNYISKKCFKCDSRFEFTKADRSIHKVTFETLEYTGHSRKEITREGWIFIPPKWHMVYGHRFWKIMETNFQIKCPACDSHLFLRTIKRTRKLIRVVEAEEPHYSCEDIREIKG